MRRYFLLAIPLLVLVLAAWLGYRALTPPADPVTVIAPPIEHPQAPGARLHTPAKANDVFRRAFWREPTPADRILHAERREWIAEGDGVRRWQWFITLYPGDELRSGLLNGSFFPLHPTTDTPSAAHFTHAPAWFPLVADPQATVLRNTEGTFWLIHDPQTNLIHATDNGGGFAISGN